MRAISDVDLSECPPVLGGFVQRTIRQFTGVQDPYREEKERCNQEASQMLPESRSIVEGSHDPLEAAVKFAIAGNIIDFAVKARPDGSDLRAALARATATVLPAKAFARFKEAIAGAERILYLADNAGEIVFDRLLVEQILPRKLTFVVRGSPTINDATLHDAQSTGISDLVEVIDNGSDIPGTVLHHCSASFQQRFRDADLVIAKGQGNFESLDEEDKTIFFLFTAKCPPVAAQLGCEVGKLVIERHDGPLYAGSER